MLLEGESGDNPIGIYFNVSIHIEIAQDQFPLEWEYIENSPGRVRMNTKLSC